MLWKWLQLWEGWLISQKASLWRVLPRMVILALWWKFADTWTLSIVYQPVSRSIEEFWFQCLMCPMVQSSFDVCILSHIMWFTEIVKVLWRIQKNVDFWMCKTFSIRFHISQEIRNEMKMWMLAITIKRIYDQHFKIASSHLTPVIQGSKG
jgi:hypothetical protein